MSSYLIKEIGKNTSKRLSKLYVIALSAVALLTIAGQFLIQQAIHDQRADSHVVNLAGSQRYLSQQIVKLSVLIDRSINHDHYNNKVDRLDEYVRMWEKGHKGLQYGDRELGLPGDNSKAVLAMFKEIDPYFKTIKASADSIVLLKKGSGENGVTISRLVNNILKTEDLFFKGMDNIVHQYDKEALAKVTFLKSAEYVLLAVTLIILLIEGLFIFRPAVVKIRETISELSQSEKRANSLAGKLKIANINLGKSLKDLKDVNFVMEKATILAKTNRYGIISFVNDKFCEILGYTPEELIGKRFSVVSSHYHGKAFFDELWETISEGKVWNKEIQNQSKDGSNVWMDVTIVPVLDSAGTPESYIAIYTDVTARFRQSLSEQKIKSASVLEGQEKERKKIARELHDGLGQMLTALKFNFDVIKGSRSKAEQEKLVELRKLVAETIQESRRISFNLMPSVLNDYGLIPAVRHLTDQMAKHSNIKVIFESEWGDERLGKAVEINLYRIIQEALNNAVKYAEADVVKISIDSLNGFLRLQISDNGKGFSPDKNNRLKVVGSGNGIVNIQERTDIINGDFRIQTAPGEGTRVLIKVPLTEIKNEKNKYSFS